MAFQCADSALVAHQALRSRVDLSIYERDSRVRAQGAYRVEDGELGYTGGAYNEVSMRAE